MHYYPIEPEEPDEWLWMSYEEEYELWLEEADEQGPRTSPAL